jgi:MoxR-like ATPase
MPTHYAGQGIAKKTTPVIVSVPKKSQHDPAGYKADTRLAKAVNLAIFLGQPLLLTGQPGTGKTQLAHSVSWELGLGPRALTFETKSTSTARDLFYTYDSLRRFHAAQNKDVVVREVNYITYTALGKALINACPYDQVKHVLRSREEHFGPVRSVVLIDEIDKAPRDFPNDLLNEIDQSFFAIPELENAKIQAPDEMRPIVIITSNSEKNLPDAFLRRCIYHHIEFPDKDTLADIVGRRIGAIEKNDRRRVGVNDAIDLLLKLREHSTHRLSKVPATAELISWIQALEDAGVDLTKPLKPQAAVIGGTLGALVKVQNDLKPASLIVNEWVS